SGRSGRAAGARAAAGQPGHGETHVSRCPDWRRLDPADRDAPGSPHAAARWREALHHLDGGCTRCRQEALAVDPTLVFRRLPAPELGPAQEAEEVAAARLAVAAMRTASRLEGRDAPDAGSSAAALHRLHGLRRLDTLRGLHTFHTFQQPHAARWALAAGLTAMALIFGSGHGWHAAGTAGTAATAATAADGQAAGADTAAMQATQGAGPSSLAPAGPAVAGMVPGAPGRAAAGVLPAASRPSIEGLSRPEARVYQLDSPHMSVVMIVDDKLDV
ncbi:MAG TPA: hypothetical protein VE075_09645, partial [Thermoanaerobaculia bacterium]|nr:hypothetical protein [Thermoanaerobaculia bacterium]